MVANELVYVQAGCSAGSLNSRDFCVASVPGTVTAVVLEEPLWTDEGRRIFGLMILAFFKLAVHHSSRSLVKEPAELRDVLEVPVDGGRPVRSFAFRSLLAPTVSASLSNGRSVANMLNDRCGDAAGVQRGHSNR